MGYGSRNTVVRVLPPGRTRCALSCRWAELEDEFGYIWSGDISRCVHLQLHSERAQHGGAQVVPGHGQDEVRNLSIRKEGSQFFKRCVIDLPLLGDLQRIRDDCALDRRELVSFTGQNGVDLLRRYPRQERCGTVVSDLVWLVERFSGRENRHLSKCRPEARVVSNVARHAEKGFERSRLVRQYLIEMVDAATHAADLRVDVLHPLRIG